MYKSSLRTFVKLLLPPFSSRVSTMLYVEQYVSDVVSSYAQVVVVELPPGVPRARAYTEYSVTHRCPDPDSADQSSHRYCPCRWHRRPRRSMTWSARSSCSL